MVGFLNAWARRSRIAAIDVYRFINASLYLKIDGCVLFNLYFFLWFLAEGLIAKAVSLQNRLLT